LPAARAFADSREKPRHAKGPQTLVKDESAHHADHWLMPNQKTPAQDRGDDGVFLAGGGEVLVDALSTGETVYAGVGTSAETFRQRFHQLVEHVDEAEDDAEMRGRIGDGQPRAIV
jgi:hypothetical protein